MKAGAAGSINPVLLLPPLLQLLTWRVPWEGAQFWEVVSAVTRGERLPIPAPTDLPGPDTEQVGCRLGLLGWLMSSLACLPPACSWVNACLLPILSLQFAGLDSYCALMQRCWAQAPADRPGFPEVVQELRRLSEHAAALRLPPSRARSLSSA